MASHPDAVEKQHHLSHSPGPCDAASLTGGFSLLLGVGLPPNHE
jgi:hypothetical protein